ncbi:MAG: hypothetical protein GY723_07950 [bacterium]|nr:hypothetical protein [bacterium]MCP5070786.1 hypothetical protein [bacterium]
MYDPKSEAHEFLANDSDEAIAKAATYFGMDRADLTIAEFGESVSGLAGRVLVVAQPSSSVGTIDGGGSRDRGPRESRGRSDRNDRNDRGDRGRGGRDRDRGDRGGRGRGGRDRDRDRGRDRDGDSDRERVAAEPEAPAEDLGPSTGEAQGDIGPIGEFVLGVIERMGLGPFQIAKETEEEKFIVYQVTGTAANGLTAGDGRTPDAIQLLANQAASRNDEDPKRIIIDVEGNRGRRDDFVERVAERAARRAQDTGRTVALEPMSPRDRRIIHVALRESDGVATMSRGEGRYRQVLVVPEGAAEYEEAEKASQASGDDE